jgi:hypothetical protein
MNITSTVDLEVLEKDSFRFIFEKGLEILNKDGQWHLQCNKNQHIVLNCREAIHTYNVKPVVVYQQLAWAQSGLLLSLRTDKFLNSTFNQILTLPSENQTAYEKIIFHAINFRHNVGSVLYHCQRLAEVYAYIRRDFINTGIQPQAEKISFSPYFETPYFDFEALVTAAVRFYETMRFLLWNTFEHTGSTPRSLEGALEHSHQIPRDLINYLGESKARIADKAKSYRDCIAHNFPAFRGGPNVTMERVQNGSWLIVALIPDNPECKSQKRFAYDLGVDALQFGWQLTNEIAEVANTVTGKVREELAKNQS